MADSYTNHILQGIKEVGVKFDKKAEEIKQEHGRQISSLEDRLDKIEAAKAKSVNSSTSEFDEKLSSEILKKADAFGRLARGEKGAKVEIELKAAGTVTTANVTGGTVWGSQYKPGIVEKPTARTHMRDVLSVLPTGAGTDFYFMRDNGGEGAPAPHTEGTTKSQFDTDLVESSVKFETIAGFEVISRKALNNIPGLVAFIQKNAMNRYLDAEDAQILYGDGNSPNLKGILTSGNFTASTATGVLIERIMQDIAILEDTYKRQANGILLRPVDYWSFFRNKAGGSGEYDLPLGVTIVGTQLYLWGIPCDKMPALATNAGSPTTNDYIVGDFANGADLMIQDNIRIEFFEQDADNVRKNLITMRVEGTSALPVFGSNYFIGGKI